jgi:hypothetical protein
MMNTLNVIGALTFLLAGTANAGKAAVREVSVSKIVNRGEYQMRPGETRIGIRVKTSESVEPRRGSKGSVSKAKSKKEDRVLFVAGEGKYVAQLGTGEVKFRILKAGEGEKREKREKRDKGDQPEKRERPRLNPDIERYTTNGKIDFSKLHRGF